MAVRPPVCEFGAKAPDFQLPDPDGRVFSFDQIAGLRGTLVMFICNHCPYVQAVIDRIRRDAAELQRLGIGVVAISASAMACMLEGIDWRNPQATWRPSRVG